MQENEEDSKKSKHVTRKLAARADGKKLDAKLDDQFNSGRLYACISSRPGQCGRISGYILEGKELDFYVKKMAKRKKVPTRLTPRTNSPARAASAGAETVSSGKSPTATIPRRVTQLSHQQRIRPLRTRGPLGAESRRTESGRWCGFADCRARRLPKAHRIAH
jgi:hypothetical protein